MVGDSLSHLSWDLNPRPPAIFALSATDNPLFLPIFPDSNVLTTELTGWFANKFVVGTK